MATNWVLAAIEQHSYSTSVALADATRCLSYAEMWKKSGALAARLGAPGNRPIAITMERGLEEAIAILAVLRAGAFYVPIDPKAPAARISELLEEVQPAAILATASAASALPRSARPIIVDLAIEGEASVPNAPVQLDADAIMYSLFTSGSTGRPKTVDVTHANFATFLGGMKEVLQPPNEPVICSVTSSSFDIFALELFLPLTTGGTFFRVSDAHVISMHLLGHTLTKLQPDVVQATPTLWRALLDNGFVFQRATRIMCGGEAMDGTLAKRLVQASAGGDVLNVYGPTEATVWATWHRVRGDETIVPIGRALPGYDVLVVDHEGRQVRDGTRGEIAILGAGVAKGYRGRPELTQERFRDLVWSDGSKRRAYFTGDVGEMKPEGLIFWGRLDHQVKIDGHRIELGEIEAALGATPGVKQACVVVKSRDDDEHKRLWAFVTASDSGPTPTEASLRAALSARLPSYMVPAKLVVIDAMPLTVSNKIDRKQLLERCVSKAEGGSLDAFETFLLTTLRQILRRPRVGADDDFFDHGGNSIRVVQLITKLDNAFGLKVPFKTITDQRSTRKIAAYFKADPARYTGLLATASELVAEQAPVGA